MKVQDVLTKRGRSLIAGAGIAAAIVLNGLGGGSASAAELQTGPSGCVTLPAEQSQPPAPGASAAGTSATVTTQDEAGTTAGAPTTAESCAVEVGGAPIQEQTTVSVDVCVTSSGVVVQTVPGTGTGEVVTGGTTESKPGTTTLTPVTPDVQTKPAEGSTAATANGELTVSQGTLSATGSVASTESTCISVSVSNGQPSISFSTEPSLTVEPAPATLPSGGGAPAAGETAPSQPGAGTGTGTQTAPESTTPQPGQ